jgi:hypothetical protein
MEYVDELKRMRTEYNKVGFVCGVAVAREKRPLGRWTNAEKMGFAQAMKKGYEEEDLGIFIETGAKSNVTIVDVDNKGDDFQQLVEQVDSYCAGIKPAIIQTGGGGRHYYFQYCGDLKTCTGKKEKGKSGIDIRSDRGIVIAPPTIHESRQKYELISGHMGDLPPVPDGLKKWLLERTEKKKGKGNSPKNKGVKKKEASKPAIKKKKTRYKPGELLIKEPVYEGCRNESLYRHLCSRRGSGFTSKEIWDDAHRVNAMYMNPPLEQDEVRKIVGSICKLVPGRRRIRLVQQSKTETNTKQIRAFLSECCEVGKQEEVVKSELYEKYCGWIEKPMADKEFFRLLREQVFVEQTRRGHRERTYVLRGVGLRAQDDWQKCSGEAGRHTGGTQFLSEYKKCFELNGVNRQDATACCE